MLAYTVAPLGPVFAPVQPRAGARPAVRPSASSFPASDCTRFASAGQTGWNTNRLAQLDTVFTYVRQRLNVPDYEPVPPVDELDAEIVHPLVRVLEAARGQKPLRTETAEQDSEFFAPFLERFKQLSEAAQENLTALLVARAPVRPSRPDVPNVLMEAAGLAMDYTPFRLSMAFMLALHNADRLGEAGSSAQALVPMLIQPDNRVKLGGVLRRMERRFAPNMELACKVADLVRITSSKAHYAVAQASHDIVLPSQPTETLALRQPPPPPPRLGWLKAAFFSVFKGLAPSSPPPNNRA